MKNFSYLDLDGRSIRLFLEVLNSGSVSGAAEKLGVTQSTVSYTLDKLRFIFKDPLFVKSGRRIVPTGYAINLGERLKDVLDDLINITSPTGFDPLQSSATVNVMVNELPRSLIMPKVSQIIQNEASDFQIVMRENCKISSDVYDVGACDLVIDSKVPEVPNTKYTELLIMDLVCVYDSSIRKAPKTAEDLMEAVHLSTEFINDAELTVLNADLHANSVKKSPVVLSSYSDVADFIRGTPFVVVLPRIAVMSTMREFAYCNLPFPHTPISFYMCWHNRADNDAAMQWLREIIVEVCASLQSALTLNTENFPMQAMENSSRSENVINLYQPS